MKNRLFFILLRGDKHDPTKTNPPDRLGCIAMKKYHGTPIGGRRDDLPRFLNGRHALIPWRRAEDAGIVAEACESFICDNSAYSFWSTHEEPDWNDYYRWIDTLIYHPGFDFALIPDVIDGTEQQNDDLLAQWPWDFGGVPVWHMHESLERLRRLCLAYSIVALGSSGEWPTPGRLKWWHRMGEAMDVCCDDGRPVSKLHGLRMLDPAIFHRLPLASADSTNVARNASRKAQQCQCSVASARELIAERIEMHNSAARWVPTREQRTLCYMGVEHD